MNGVRKVVVSTTLKSAAAWRNSTLISGNVVEEVRKLKNQPGKNILMDGSSVLIHTLVENDLVDEYSLHVYPLVLGSGKRLFPEGKRINLKLIESQALPTGVVFQHYERDVTVRLSTLPVGEQGHIKVKRTIEAPMREMCARSRQSVDWTRQQH